MKIFFTLLCLLISSVWANATVQNAADQDKPPRLYIKSYTEARTASGVEYFHPEVMNENTSWHDDMAGFYKYSWLTSDNDVFVNMNWPTSSWPDISATETYESTEDGTIISTNVTPNIEQEHCVANFTVQHVFFGDVQQLALWRTADTAMKIQTGGKSISMVRNLFGITATATQNLNPTNYFADVDFDEITVENVIASVPSQNISIGSYGNLSTNGAKYVVLADNSDVDVTPYAAGVNCYSFTESQQKYKLHILANGNPLAQDHVRNGANFCVGQQVTFQALFTPPVPGLVSTNVTWNYTLDYINNFYTNSDGCEIYNDAPIPAMSNPTTAWFCNSQTQNGTAELGVYCQFGNGQTAYLVRQGMFNVFTPSITVAPQNPPGPPSVNIDSVDLQPVIRIGLTSTNTGQLYDLMAFDGNVVSELQFPGEVIVTQLINRNTSIDGVSFGGTGGSYYLDSNVVYPQSDDAVSANISGSECVGTSSFGDGPYIGIQEASWASINDHFQTYFRFRPSGTGNIYVTLELVNWDWNAYVQYTGINPLSLSSWTISSSGIDGPTFTPSNVFPQWSSTY
jgi:hypothetical protein